MEWIGSHLYFTRTKSIPMFYPENQITTNQFRPCFLAFHFFTWDYYAFIETTCNSTMFQPLNKHNKYSLQSAKSGFRILFDSGPSFHSSLAVLFVANSSNDGCSLLYVGSVRKRANGEGFAADQLVGWVSC